MIIASGNLVGITQRNINITLDPY